MNTTAAPETAGPSPGLYRKPGHTIRIEKQHRPVTVRFGGMVIAESRKAVTLYEADYQPVQYIPLADVKTEYLEESDHTTYCPYKGEAKYWTLKVDGRTLHDVVWHYPKPFDECAQLIGYVSFYPHKVEVDVAGF